MLTYGLPVVYVSNIKNVLKILKIFLTRMLLLLKQIYSIGMAGRLCWLKINAECI